MNLKHFAVALAIALATAVWLLRFDIVAASSADAYPIAYRLDRWTGKVMLAVPAGTKELEPLAPLSQSKPNPFDRFDK